MTCRFEVILTINDCLLTKGTFGKAMASSSASLQVGGFQRPAMLRFHRRRIEWT